MPLEGVYVRRIHVEKTMLTIETTYHIQRIGTLNRSPRQAPLEARRKLRTLVGSATRSVLYFRVCKIISYCQKAHVTHHKWKNVKIPISSTWYFSSIAEPMCHFPVTYLQKCVPIVLPPFWAFSSFCHISKSQKVPCERSEADIRKINTIKVTLYTPNDLRMTSETAVNRLYRPEMHILHHLSFTDTSQLLRNAFADAASATDLYPKQQHDFIKNPLYRPEMLVFGDILRIWHYSTSEGFEQHAPDAEPAERDGEPDAILRTASEALPNSLRTSEQK